MQIVTTSMTMNLLGSLPTSLRSRFIVAIAAMLFPLAVLAGIEFIALRMAVRSFEGAAAAASATLSPVTHLQALLPRASIAVHHYVLQGRLEDRQRFGGLSHQIDLTFDEAKAALKPGREVILARSAGGEWLRAKGIALAMLARSTDAPGGRNLDLFDAHIGGAMDALDEVIVQTRQDIENELSAARGVERKGLFLMVAIFLAGLGIASGIGTLLARSVLIPLQVLELGVDRFAGGDFAHRIPLVSEDELGKLASTFNTMAERIERSVAEGVEHLQAERVEKFQAELAYQALHDPVTNLANRVLFFDRVAHAVARWDRHNEHLAVLLLDLDGFKTINDSLGHAAGDQLLIAVSERLRACLRPEDTIARLGGDEFAILLEGMGDTVDATHVARRIIAALETSFALADTEVNVECSIGIVLGGPKDERADELLRNADLAMYMAKAHGKARYEVFDPSMYVVVRESLELETDLRGAVERQDFTLHYQPVIAIATGKVVAVEALVRWKHPQRGLVPPLAFIPLAEETGLILPIGRWVLQRACRQGGWWQVQFPSDPPLMMSVNLSAKQFQHPGLVEEVTQALRGSGLDPRCLIVEITESALMQDVEATIGNLRTLKELGVRVAIDDFGTGYSSLNYLRRFPIDIVKIDNSFIHGLGVDPEQLALVRAVIALGQALNLQVVAEGVERGEELEQLRSLHCHLAQGSYFAWPTDHEGVAKFLTKARHPDPRLSGSRPGSAISLRSPS